LKKRLSILEEFKQFILRGNVMDLAVGVIIGGAFNKIVTSLVNDVIMPFLSFIIGTDSLNSKFIALDGKTYGSLAEAGSAPLFKYGSFIATILDFLLMGFAIFLLVKVLNFINGRFKKEKPIEAPPAETRECPYCFSGVNARAVVCPFCTSKIGASGA